MLPNLITKKLLIKPGCNLLLVNAPANYTGILGSMPDGTHLNLTAFGTYNVILLFTINTQELNRDLVWLQKHLRPDTVFWIIYPKKRSGIESDLEMMSNWDQLAKYGYNSVAAAAVNEIWTALRFRPADQIKKSDAGSSEIPKNDFSNYIDVSNRVITLPGDLQAQLEKHPEALTFFRQLSFTNKKEYVVWILSARQEKTREERIIKTIGKLVDLKKNPADK